MKLQEFINDDTCQILCAIILGIVICWFIFGQGCGCGNGFSVGGPCTGTPDDDNAQFSCNTWTEDQCNNNPLARGCSWQAANAPAGTDPAPAGTDPVTVPVNVPYTTECPSQFVPEDPEAKFCYVGHAPHTEDIACKDIKSNENDLCDNAWFTEFDTSLGKQCHWVGGNVGCT